MKIFSFVKKVFVLRLTILPNIINALECISMKNQECKVRPDSIFYNFYWNYYLFCLLQSVFH